MATLVERHNLSIWYSHERRGGGLLLSCLFFQQCPKWIPQSKMGLWFLFCVSPSTNTHCCLFSYRSLVFFFYSGLLLLLRNGIWTHHSYQSTPQGFQHLSKHFHRGSDDYCIHISSQPGITRLSSTIYSVSLTIEGELISDFSWYWAWLRHPARSWLYTDINGLNSHYERGCSFSPQQPMPKIDSFQGSVFPVSYKLCVSHVSRSCI